MATTTATARASSPVPPSGELSTLFLRLGLDAKTAEASARSAKVGPALFALMAAAGALEDGGGCERAVGLLLQHLATKGLSAATSVHYAHLQDVVDAICVEPRGLRSVPQVDAAAEYLKKGSEAGAPYSRAEMERRSGVGVTWTDADIDAAIASVLDASAAALSSERYRAVSRLLGLVTSRLQWADGRRVKERFDAEVARRLGPRTEEDAGPAPTAAANKKAAAERNGHSEPSAPAVRPSPARGGSDAALPLPPSSSSALSSPSPSFLSLPPSVLSSAAAMSSFLTDIDGREIAAGRNTAAQLSRHEAVVPRGRVRSRFPPEPNGYLHLGHAKAMNFNFGLATATAGECFLRFDDTNPEAEKLDYIQQILENVQWLGHRPSAITYSSEYFPQLYDLAVRLIRAGHAYVDHQTAAEIRAAREAKTGTKAASPWRERPIEESVRLFDDMRRGKFEEGAATLRMKGDLSHPNPQMWDLVAYRIKYAPHPHVGDSWSVRERERGQDHRAERYRS